MVITEWGMIQVHGTEQDTYISKKYGNFFRFFPLGTLLFRFGEKQHWKLSFKQKIENWYRILNNYSITIIFGHFIENMIVKGWSLHFVFTIYWYCNVNIHDARCVHYKIKIRNEDGLYTHDVSDTRDNAQ